MNITELQKDPEFQSLTSEARNKSYWAYAMTGIAAVTGIVTLGLIASAFVPLPFIGKLAFDAALGTNIAMAGVATVTSWFTSDSMRDDATAAKDKLTNFIEKKVEGKTDKDLADRINVLEHKLDEVSHSQGTGEWASRVAGTGKEPTQPWRNFIAEQTLDLEQQR